MSRPAKRKFPNLMIVSSVIALGLPAMSHAEGVLVTFPRLLAVSEIVEPVALDTMALVVDFAAIVQMNEDIGSIVLGNAAIADAMVADGRMIVLTGKSIGMTNMIVLDASNQILAQMTLQVGGRKPGTVTVRRALEMQSYGCNAGLCTESSVALAEFPDDPVPAPL